MENINSVYLVFVFFLTPVLSYIFLYFLAIIRKYNKIYKIFKGINGLKGSFISGDLKYVPNLPGNKESRELNILEYISGLIRLFNKDLIIKFWLSWRPVIVVYKPESAEAVLTHSRNLKKGQEYVFLREWLGLGLLTSTGEKWHSRRKILTPAFHFSILKDFLPIFNDKSQIFVNKLKADTKKEWVDIMPLASLLTLDIICETAMGVNINAQVNSESEYTKAVKRTGMETTQRSLNPWLWNDLIYFLSPSGREYRKNLKVLKNFTRKIIKERKESILNNHDENTENEDIYGKSKRRKAFLDLLLDIHIKDKILSEEDIQEEVDTFMFEGHDTTAVGIGWALYNIGLYPKVQEKIYEELQSIFGDDVTRPVTSEDLTQMKYLENALKESQRLYPSVPVISRELEEDIILGKQVMPKGAHIYVYVIGLHHDPDIYPNPEIFEPDRFLPENCVNRHNFAYIPFSAGKRNCIGQKFALMEEKTVVANILRNYSIQSLDHRDKIVCTDQLVLRPTDSLRIKIKKR